MTDCTLVEELNVTSHPQEKRIPRPFDAASKVLLMPRKVFRRMKNEQTPHIPRFC